MPDEITEALTRIAQTLPPVDWPEPAQLRRRATVRRRQRTVVGAVAVAACVALGTLIVHPGQISAGFGVGAGSGTGPANTGPCGGRKVAHIALPAQKAITVNVYNGTLEDGLAAEVGDQLRSRGFTLGHVANASEVGVTADGLIAVIRYGPSQVGAAWVVLAYFPDARMDFDLERSDGTVDVVLGSNFISLPSLVEVNRNIAANGRATLPPGTCAGD